MRKIFLFMNVSLDGYVADANNDISGFTNDFEAFSSSGDEVDTLLFGRKTYDMMKFWGTTQGQAAMPEVAKFMNETHKFVVSHNTFDAGWQNVTVLSDNPIDAVKKLKEQAGKTIAIFGSNNLCVSLMQANLIDEFQIVVNPVVFGDGTSLFKSLPAKAALTLTDTRKFKSGSIMLTYVPSK